MLRFRRFSTTTHFSFRDCIDLYEAGFDNSYLTSAIQLTERMRELFEDTANGGFFSATEADPSLVLRIKEDYDGAEPSGNSIAIANLLRLGHMTGRSDFTDSAEKALAAFSGKMTAGPTSLPQMLAAALLASTPPRQIVLGRTAGGAYAVSRRASDSVPAVSHVALVRERRNQFRTAEYARREWISGSATFARILRANYLSLGPQI